MEDREVKLATFVPPGGTERVGIPLDGESILDLAAAWRQTGQVGSPPDSVIELLRGGDETLAATRRVVEDVGSIGSISGERVRYPLSEVRLRAPIPHPGKILCVGRNYWEHAEENIRGWGATGVDFKMPPYPKAFIKAASCVIGLDDDIIHPAFTRALDYELEFSIVIGRTAQYVTEAEAMDYVVGYTIVNDVSARDVQHQESVFKQHCLGKNFATAAPMGPFIALKDEIPDPHAVDVELRVNGVVGFVVGVLPGAGATIASFLSYALERRVSKHPERFGTGVMEGVAGPESANNASTGGALIPLLSLGIPGSGTAAVMLGALMIFGIRPGPLLFQDHAEFAWTVIASLYISNAILLMLNVPLVPIFASVLRIPYVYLYPVIVGFAIVGTFSLSNDVFDVWVMMVFGALGYAFRKLDLPAAPMILGLVLGPLLERSLVQSLTMSQGGGSHYLRDPPRLCRDGNLSWAACAGAHGAATDELPKLGNHVIPSCRRVSAVVPCYWERRGR